MSAPSNLAVVQDGFVVLYHQGESNHCPSCGKSHWDVRRTTAQCAFCDTALPLAAPLDPVEREIIPAQKGTDHGLTPPQG